ncbi:MAG: UDP-glucose/iron transport system permease protein [Acidobacteriaceae bacterium]|jgi:putative ABC transport system permease protein|nr:UDP-glucose/iron transport system permease protein [Acidobacteriaceae bacterium]
MLKWFFTDQLRLGLVQAAVAALSAIVLVLLARRRGVHLEKETAVAMVRGVLQIVAVGSLLVLLLHGPKWSSVFLLAGMIVAAGATSADGRTDCPMLSEFPRGQSHSGRDR